MRSSLEGFGFLALFSAIADALILTDKIGRIVEINSATQQLLGYSTEEITDKMIESVIPDYYQACRSLRRDQLNGYREKRLADQSKGLIAICRDGSQLQVEINLGILQSPKYFYNLLTIYDTSWQWAQKQRISENVESQRAMIEQAIVGIVRTDLQGNITLTNDFFCDITGYSQEQLQGRNMLDLTHPDDRHRHIKLFRQMVKEGQPFTLEARYLRRNGELAWVNISVSRICDALRCPSSSVAVVMDVTERTLTALALQASEERLRQAERAANLGIFDMDLLTNKMQCNNRIRDIWGFSQDELLSCESFLACIHPEDRAERNQVLAEPFKTLGTGEYMLEYRVINRKENYETWVSEIGRIFFNGEQASRLVGVIQDVSKRKFNEQKRQESSKAMGSLLKQQVAAQTASAIAHELNQPLAAISAYSEVARQILSRNSVKLDKLHRALQGCIDQAHRAGRTLHELLNFLQQNKIVSERLDINNVIRETIGIVQNDGFGGFHVELKLQENLPTIFSNRLQIQMVLINLLRNGVEAARDTKVTPTITIITQTVIEKNMVMVSVKDNGPGLDTETTKRIFEPFFTTKSGGIGMGLSISRALIEANGGKHWFDLNNKPGAVFHFTLPISL